MMVVRIRQQGGYCKDTNKHVLRFEHGLRSVGIAIILQNSLRKQEGGLICCTTVELFKSVKVG